MDYSTLYSHKYICELYMDKTEKINWIKLPIVYMNKDYVYYTVAGGSMLRYKSISSLIETLEENSRFDNLFDRVSYMFNTIKNSGRYYFWDSFIESDEGKKFKRCLEDFYENRYYFERKKEIGLQINKLDKDKNKLLAQIKKIDENIEELQNKLDKM